MIPAETETLLDVDQSIVLEIKGQIKEHVAEALKQEKDAKDHGEEIQSVKKDVQEDINDIDEDINNFDEGEDNTSQVHENNDDDKESKSIHASSTLKESNKGQHFIFEGEDNERNNH